MANFDEFKEKAIETVEIIADKSVVFVRNVADKTKIVAQITKLKADISTDREAMRKNFKLIGKRYYELHKDDPEDGLAQLVEEVARTEKRITESKEEIEALKKELYAAKKKASDSENKISVMKEEHASDLQELLELRDLVYKIQNSSGEEEVKQESSVSFPYRTNARVVVYGGHATWLKVIVKLLPNVKFIDPYADPDVNTIRNADIVWMQTNAMPHNKYNKIMEIVRMKKIPVKYFAYASAEKCAVQLAEYDMQTGTD